MSNVKSTASEMYVQYTKRFSLRILSITLQHKLTLDSLVEATLVKILFDCNLQHQCIESIGSFVQLKFELETTLKRLLIYHRFRPNKNICLFPVT